MSLHERLHEQLSSESVVLVFIQKEIHRAVIHFEISKMEYMNTRSLIHRGCLCLLKLMADITIANIISETIGTCKTVLNSLINQAAFPLIVELSTTPLFVQIVPTSLDKRLHLTALIMQLREEMYN